MGLSWEGDRGSGMKHSGMVSSSLAVQVVFRGERSEVEDVRGDAPRRGPEESREMDLGEKGGGTVPSPFQTRGRGLPQV